MSIKNNTYKNKIIFNCNKLLQYLHNSKAEVVLALRIKGSRLVILLATISTSTPRQATSPMSVGIGTTTCLTRARLLAMSTIPPRTRTRTMGRGCWLRDRLNRYTKYNLNVEDAPDVRNNNLESYIFTNYNVKMTA